MERFSEALESRLSEVEARVQSLEPSLRKVLNAIDYRVSRMEAPPLLNRDSLQQALTAFWLGEESFFTMVGDSGSRES